jgi:hypothetical protein
MILSEQIRAIRGVSVAHFQGYLGAFGFLLRCFFGAASMLLRCSFARDRSTTEAPPKEHRRKDEERQG